jgi:hypothetical protein
MNIILQVLLFLLCSTTFAYSEIVSLDNGAVSFDAPDGFKPLTKELIEIKFPRSRAPKYVVGNQRATTTVAYDLKDDAVPEEKIGEVLDSFYGMFPKIIPGITWKEKKIMEFEGKKWGYLELTSSAIDTDIYNIMLFTSYKGKLLIFNFNSTKSDFPTYEKALRESIKSIRIKN